jgi:preprotein translocase subunit YajC
MNDFLANLPLLQEGGASGQMLTMILPFGLIILVFYFLIIRPQNKKQKETQRMLGALKKNDKVSTVGGIRGTVVSVKDDAVVVKVDANVKLEFSKSSISKVLDSGSGRSADKGAESKGAEKEKDAKEDDNPPSKEQKKE